MARKQARKSTGAAAIAGTAATARGRPQGPPATFMRTIGTVEFVFRPLGRAGLLLALGERLVDLIQEAETSKTDPAEALLGAIGKMNPTEMMALVYRMLEPTMVSPALGYTTDADREIISIDDLIGAGIWETVFLAALTGTLEAWTRPTADDVGDGATVN